MTDGKAKKSTEAKCYNNVTDRKVVATEDVKKAVSVAVQNYGSTTLGARLGSSPAVLLSIMCDVAVAQASMERVRVGLVKLGLLEGLPF